MNTWTSLDDQDVSAGQWMENNPNCDGDFNSSDFVTAFQDGGFEMGPRNDPVAVPEPSGIIAIVIGACLLLSSRRR